MYRHIEIFSSRIGTFSLCIGLGLISIAFLVAQRLRAVNADNDFETKVMVCIPFSLLSGCVTGYVSDVIFRGGFRALAHPWGYGVTFFGWLTGCVLFFCVYAKVVHIKTMFLLNTFLPAFSLAQAFGRIGCFCGGCCFGRPSPLLGVRFPPDSLPFSVYGDTPLFPVQLLESAYLLLVFAILYRFVRFPYRAAVYLMLMPAGRFAWEFLRGDNRGSLGVSFLSPSQIVSIFLFAAGVFLLLYNQKTKRGECVPE